MINFVAVKAKSLGWFCVIVGFVVLRLNGYYESKNLPAAAQPMGGLAVVIDPGHGGIDAGASANNVTEKELNLAVANYLKDYITSGGGVVYRTRTEDTNTADPDRKKGESQKMSDLKVRKKSAEKYDADIFISIHMNKFSDGKYKGLQVFYDNNIPESKILADFIQNSSKAVLADGNTRIAKGTGDKIYILKGNKIPSVLVECGFLSNEDEAAKLKTPDYQQKVAWGIYMGILEYINR